MSVLNEGVIMENIEKASCLLLDVAGTTTKLGFIKETLFPYFEKELKSYITSNLKNEDLTTAIKQIDAFKAKDLDLEKEDQLQELIVELIKLTKEDSNSEGVKTLQGKVYAEGYKNGNLKGHVYPDVATVFPLWAANKTLCIYSTGSVESQKLLFLNSTEGDLSSHITQYFDQSVGPKTEAASYLKIVEKLESKPELIVFLTDNLKEAKAAHEAGLTAVLVIREGNEVISDEEKAAFLTITSFSDLTLSKPKRKIEEVEEIEVPPSKVAKTVEENKEETMEVDSNEVKPDIKPAEGGETKEEITSSTLKTEQKSEQLETAKDAKTEEVAKEPESSKDDTSNSEKEVTKMEEESTVPTKDSETEASSTTTNVEEKEKPKENEKSEEKKESETAMECDKPEVEKKESQVTEVNNKETETASVAEKEAESVSEEKPSETEEEKKAVVEKKENGDINDKAQSQEDAGAAEDKQRTDEPTKPADNTKATDETTTVQNGETKADKAEDTKESSCADKKEAQEKENIADVANGVSAETDKKENGDEKQNGDVKENGSTVEAKDTAAATAADMKVKKIENEEASTELSVEA